MHAICEKPHKDGERRERLDGPLEPGRRVPVGSGRWSTARAKRARTRLMR